jgi:hypothetical protein
MLSFDRPWRDGSPLFDINPAINCWATFISSLPLSNRRLRRWNGRDRFVVGLRGRLRLKLKISAVLIALRDELLPNEL